MARRINSETEAVNADSFLDIVASIVSIMIIMVLMTGLKIKNTPVDVALTGEAAQLTTDLTNELAAEQSLQGDVWKTAAEIQNLQQETLARQHERDLLALAVTSLEQKVHGTKQELDSQSEQGRELGQKVSLARARLEELGQQRVAVESAPAPAVQVECYPTPLSRTVDGRELHFQLRAGRLAFIPLDSLVEKFKSDAEHKVYRVRDLPEMTDTVGPEGGFRLRYTLQKHEITADEARHLGHGGAYAQLKRWTLIPVADDLGETLPEALADGSQFRQTLADRRSRGATVTIWAYPDSFDAFRQLKKELYRLGFPVAARPLAQGMHISGSPDGSKSAAE
jgi:hypothetical protein